MREYYTDLDNVFYAVYYFNDSMHVEDIDDTSNIDTSLYGAFEFKTLDEAKAAAYAIFQVRDDINTCAVIKQCYGFTESGMFDIIDTEQIGIIRSAEDITPPEKYN